jgi:hypothetical protein
MNATLNHFKQKHANETPFMCANCNALHKWPTSYARHLRKCTATDDECEIVKYEPSEAGSGTDDAVDYSPSDDFDSKPAVHVKLDEQVVDVASLSSMLKHKCRVCPVQCATRRRLREHMRQHADTAKFLCPKCKRECSNVCADKPCRCIPFCTRLYSTHELVCGEQEWDIERTCAVE